MELLLQEFYQDRKLKRAQERKLKKAIAERETDIAEQNKQYKECLKANREAEADKIFEKQDELEKQNRSDKKKLAELVPIHNEALAEKATEILSNDLKPLMNQQAGKMADLMLEEQDLQKRLDDIGLEKFRLEKETDELFSSYSGIAESTGLKEKHKTWFNREPFGYAEDFAGRKLQSKAKQLMSRGYKRGKQA